MAIPTIDSDKVTAQLGSGVTAAKRVLDTKVVPYIDNVVVPYAVPAGQKAAKQVRQVAQERIAPMASAAVDNALVASAPVRREALRRGRLAASALRGDNAAVISATSKRRWPIAVVFLLIGGAAGAVAAWFSQAGKPVQLSPYPLPTEQSDESSADSDSTNETLDLTQDSPAPHA
jgi:hypothetical protein